MADNEYESHTVEQGEDLISIAEKYRASAEAIWNDGANASLREERKSPFVLYPGDVLAIPPMRPKRINIATDKLHTFRRKGLKEKLILHLLHNDKPRAGVNYLLKIEKRPMPGVTDATGKIEHWVKPTDRNGVLEILDPPPEGIPSPEIYEVLLGHLDPVENESGVRARLVNLGFLDDMNADETALKVAIEDFQHHWKLRMTGKADEKTRAKLIEIHES